MKWETHGQKQTMEDTRKGKQAKESATTAEADWWLKTDELGDRYLNPEKDGKRNMMGNKWLQRKDIRTAGHHQTSRARLGDKQRETSEDRHPETGSHWPEWETQGGRRQVKKNIQRVGPMNPAVQTKSSDGVKFKSKGSNWKTIGRGNWGLNLLVADNWAVWGLNGIEDNWERIGRAHLEQNPSELEDHIWKTNARPLGGEWDTTSWKTTGKKQGDK